MALPGAGIRKRTAMGGTMAVGICVKLAGVTAEQFDQLEAALNARANRPDGLIFHASGPIDGGWGVMDFWESRADFDRFAADRIAPAMAAPRRRGRARHPRVPGTRVPRIATRRRRT
jgi:hypothetical protein